MLTATNARVARWALGVGASLPVFAQKLGVPHAPKADAPQRDSAAGHRLWVRRSALGARLRREGQEDVPDAEGFLSTDPAESRGLTAEGRHSYAALTRVKLPACRRTRDA